MTDESTSPVIQFSLLDTSSSLAVGRFMFWLFYGHWPELYTREHSENQPLSDPERSIDLVEEFWLWDAPRKRMLKLLWSLLQSNTKERYFDSRFTARLPRFVEDASSCAELLSPIRERLLNVLDGIEQVAQKDLTIGQAGWGEELFLPSEQARQVREQLSKARVDLLEKSADYTIAIETHLKNLIRYHTAALDIPFNSLDREYRFEAGIDGQYLVWVVTGNRREGLVSASDPLGEPGAGFGWGYFGGEPYNLALSILADATGGDIRLAERFAEAHIETPQPVSIAELESLEEGQPSFINDFIEPMSGATPPPVTRTEVIEWLVNHGVDESELSKYEIELAQRNKQFKSEIKKYKDILSNIDIHGLRTQRFDLVPQDFECALYLDLMGYLRSGGRFMKCGYCGSVIPSDGSPRSSQQIARWRKDLSVYHPECAISVNKKNKRADQRRRMQDPSYRENHRRSAENHRNRQNATEMNGNQIDR